MTHKLIITLTLIVSSFHALAQQGGHEHDDEGTKIRYFYELSALYDDNIRRAKSDNDIREDSVAGLSLGLKTITHLTDFTMLNTSLRFEGEKHNEFVELDQTKVEGEIKYQFAFSSGFSSSIYALKLKLGGIDSNSEMRTATTGSLGLDINKWLTTTIHMTSAIAFKVQESQSEVFDTEETQFMINFDVDLTPRQLVYFTFHFIDGDIVSSGTPQLDFINVAQSIEPDDAFGGLDTNQFAYRVDAQSKVFTLGYNAALSRSLSLDLSWRFVDSEAKDNPKVWYERNIARVSILGRF